ncbi:MAG: STAS domain-containing protein [Planctomycetota bacterium]|jgi:anti-anti-sigma factor
MKTGQIMMTKAKVFSVEIVEHVVVVTPNGDASAFRYQDIHTATNTLVDSIARQKVQRMVVDFGEVDVVGSIMISSIIKLARSIARQQGTAVFCNSSETMQNVISTMNLTKLWPYYESRDEAVAALMASN